MEERREGKGGKEVGEKVSQRQAVTGDGGGWRRPHAVNTYGHDRVTCGGAGSQPCASSGGYGGSLDVSIGRACSGAHCSR